MNFIHLQKRIRAAITMVTPNEEFLHKFSLDVYNFALIILEILLY